MITDCPPRRVRVEGDYFHGKIPEGAIYVGRGAPGIRGSKYANQFRLNRGMPRAHPLRRYLDAATRIVGGMTPAELAAPANDILRPATARIATTAFYWWFSCQADLVAAAGEELAGRDLCCWCPEPQPGEPDWCHAFTLLVRVNGPAVIVPRQPVSARDW